MIPNPTGSVACASQLHANKPLRGETIGKRKSAADKLRRTLIARSTEHRRRGYNNPGKSLRSFTYSNSDLNFKSRSRTQLLLRKCISSLFNRKSLKQVCNYKDLLYNTAITTITIFSHPRSRIIPRQIWSTQYVKSSQPCRTPRFPPFEQLNWEDPIVLVLVN